MKKILLPFFLVCFIGFIVFMYCFDKFTNLSDFRVVGHKDNGLLDKINVVPNEETALMIAKSVWRPIYGTKNLFGYSYKIELIDEKFWAVIGVNRIQRYFKINSGGPYIEIDMKTGRIIHVGHTAADPKARNIKK